MSQLRPFRIARLALALLLASHCVSALPRSAPDPTAKKRAEFYTLVNGEEARARCEYLNKLIIETNCNQTAPINTQQKSAKPRPRSAGYVVDQSTAPEKAVAVFIQ